MKRYVLILTILALAGTSLALDLPEPPRGYAWKECLDIRGALLVPDGWHFRRAEADGKVAYFITPEPYEPPATFDVGFTFNIVPDVPQKTGKAPTGFARELIGSVTSSYPNARTWQSDLGSFKGHGAIYQETKEGSVSQHYKMVLANDATGTAYLVSFDAPAADWEREWATIEPVVQKLAIDDEI